jgi:NAD(P)-dependent dehydrogenase (short-subunit alcohol dehydrogenase family)
VSKALADDLDGHVIVVTGASRGIGRGLARHLGDRGARLVVSSRGHDGLKAVSEELSDCSIAHVAVTADAGDRDASFALVSEGLRAFGTIDGIVANAQSSDGPAAVADITDEALNVALTAGVKGTLWLMQAVYPTMKAQQRGRIVTMGSNAALVGAPMYGAYSAAKEAIRGLTRTAATEWGRFGITVNCVCPISVRHHTPGLEDPEELKRFERGFSRQPIPRDGQPEQDIAPIVAFLLSDASAYMTGQTLMADGGQVMLR